MFHNCVLRMRPDVRSGQSRRFWPNRATSAIHLIATGQRTSLDVRKVPIAANMHRSKSALYSITSSARASTRRAARSRPSALAVLRLMIELVLGRRLHRQVGRLLALEDAVDVAGRAPVQIDQAGSIRHQAAGLDEEAIGINRGQPVPRRERDDQLALNGRDRADPHDQTVVRPAREFGESRASALAPTARSIGLASTPSSDASRNATVVGARSIWRY